MGSREGGGGQLGIAVPFTKPGETGGEGGCRETLILRHLLSHGCGASHVCLGFRPVLNGITDVMAVDMQIIIEAGRWSGSDCVSTRDPLHTPLHTLSLEWETPMGRGSGNGGGYSWSQ